MRRWVLLLFLVAFISGCCVGGHPNVEKALKDGIAVNKGHMNDGGLPEEARLIAQDNFDFLWQIRYNLTGDEMPAEVKARMKEGAAQ